MTLWASRPPNGSAGISGYFHTFSFSKIGTAAPHLLTSVTNQLGGTASFEYRPSTVWANDYLPYPVQTVTKLTVSDGRGQSAITDFSYSGGLFDHPSNKFLGFRKVIETKPLANGETARPKVETTYRQDVASHGLVQRADFKDGAGVVRKSVIETWTVNATAKPYTALNTSTTTVLTQNISLATRIDRVFDAYSNITSEKNYGRVVPPGEAGAGSDIAGDEVWTSRSFNPNTSAYIVSAPTSEAIRDNFDPASLTLRGTVYYYDGQAAYTSPPTKGDVTRKQIRKSHALGQIIYENFTYDSWGNKLSALDGAGNRTEWTYDAMRHLFAVAERSPRYFANGSLPADTRHATSASFDDVCQQPLTRVDLNDVTHTYAYDAFCRLIDYRNTGTNFYRLISYFNDGAPANQSWVVYEPLPNAAGSSYLASYYDGRGRVWLEQKRGETASTPVRRTQTIYDARNNVARKSHPYFNGETPQYTETTYDWNDRPITVTHPDGASRTNFYYLAATLGYTSNQPLGYVRTVDELGRATQTYSSSQGQVIRIARQMEDATWRYEFRSWDPFGKLTQVRDNGLATWSYAYDNLGNRVSATDPRHGLMVLCLRRRLAHDGADRRARRGHRDELRPARPADAAPCHLAGDRQPRAGRQHLRPGARRLSQCRPADDLDQRGSDAPDRLARLGQRGPPHLDDRGQVEHHLAHRGPLAQADPHSLRPLHAQHRRRGEPVDLHGQRRPPVDPRHHHLDRI